MAKMRRIVRLIRFSWTRGPLKALRARGRQILRLLRMHVDSSALDLSDNPLQG